MDNLQKHFECVICLTDYKKGIHDPLMLKCGHNICSISSIQMYNQISKIIKWKILANILNVVYA